MGWVSSSHPPPWGRTRLGQVGPLWHLPLPPQAHAPKRWRLWMEFPPFPFFSPPLRGQGSRPFRFPSAAVSQHCQHGAHPQPRFWDGFAAFRVIPSPEQWETLLNFRVCWSLPTHHSCGWFELPISSLAQAFNWSSCQRQGGIKGRQVLQEHPPLAGREPRGPSLPPIVVLGSKT